jgi:hypothetical protein
MSPTTAHGRSNWWVLVPTRRFWVCGLSPIPRSTYDLPESISNTYLVIDTNVAHLLYSGVYPKTLSESPAVPPYHSRVPARIAANRATSPVTTFDFNARLDQKRRKTQATPMFSINSELLAHTFPVSPLLTSFYELGTGGVYTSARSPIPQLLQWPQPKVVRCQTPIGAIAPPRP